MPSPKWAKQPRRKDKTVVLTARGWVVKETKELLVSCKQLATRIAKALGVTSVAFQADKLVLTKAGTSVNLTFDKIADFIKKPGNYFVPVASVTVAPTTASKTVGQTQQLTPTVLPANALNKAVTYTTSDATKATVNSSGLVTAVAAGTATITVKTADGNKTATCVVTIT